MELKICHMYPDVLNLYGDRGDITCMVQRLKWRGIDAVVTKLPIGEKHPMSDFDLVFIGGGQDFEQQVLLEDLHKGKSRDIIAAIEDGVTFLTICGGYQMLGNYYETFDGNRCDFIGALDLYTVGTKTRMIGNYKFQCGKSSGGSVVVGFENHSGKTYLGVDMKPLGKVISGFGNNGEDETEGARYKNVFGTYCHGPLLPKNPEFCDHVLLTALKHRHGIDQLEPLNDSAELFAHDEMCAKLQGKEK